MVFSSAIHRVVTNLERERFSAAFYTPKPANKVGPINELIINMLSKMFKNANMKSYKQLFFETARGCLILSEFSTTYPFSSQQLNITFE